MSSQLLFLTHRRGQGEKDPPKPLHALRLSTKADRTSISLSIVGISSIVDDAELAAAEDTIAAAISDAANFQG